MLAMKVRSARAKGRRDIAFLVEHLGLKSAREVFDLHDEAFPHDPPKRHSFRDARDILKALWPDDRTLERDDRYGYGAASEDGATRARYVLPAASTPGATIGDSANPGADLPRGMQFVCQCIGKPCKRESLERPSGRVKSRKTMPVDTIHWVLPC